MQGKAVEVLKLDSVHPKGKLLLQGINLNNIKAFTTHTP
jgi:hypothetical protein